LFTLCHEFHKFLSSEVQVKLFSVSSYAHEKLLHLKSFLKSFDLLASIFMFSLAILIKLFNIDIITLDVGN